MPMIVGSKELDRGPTQKFALGRHIKYIFEKCNFLAFLGLFFHVLRIFLSIIAYMLAKFSI